MRTDGSRVLPMVFLAAATAVVISWALRAHAEHLPALSASGHAVLLAAGHAHGGADVFVPPPPVSGDALANHLGLAMLAAHVMLAGIALAARLTRRWSTMDGLLGRLPFAAAVAVVAAAVAALVASVAMGSAITTDGTLEAAAVVLRYTFVLALVGSFVTGVPWRRPAVPGGAPPTPSRER